jgi:hypothetical protein
VTWRGSARLATALAILPSPRSPPLPAGGIDAVDGKARRGGRGGGSSWRGRQCLGPIGYRIGPAIGAWGVERGAVGGGIGRGRWDARACIFHEGWP